MLLLDLGLKNCCWKYITDVTVISDLSLLFNL